MSTLDISALPDRVRALHQAMTAGRPREEPDPTTLPLLEQGLSADLHAVVHAWTYHGRPSNNELRAWDVFETWDFIFSVAPVSAEEVRRVCNVLAPGSRTTFPDGPYVQLGADAGGRMLFAGATAGATALFGPEADFDWTSIEDWLIWLEEGGGYEPDPALAPFLASD